MAITALEWELLSFFEAEPKLEDQRIPWEFNTAVYTTQVGNFRVCCSVSPHYPDITIAIHDGDAMFFEMTALGIRDVRYCKVAGVETLEIQVAAKHKFLLAIRPMLRIENTIGFDT